MLYSMEIMERQYIYKVEKEPSPAFALFVGSLVLSGMLFWASATKEAQDAPVYIVDTVYEAVALSAINYPVKVNVAPGKVKASLTWSPQDHWDAAVVDYITRFKEVAKAEQRMYNIPAGVSMAQALLETENGKSYLAAQANNHFGIKCAASACPRGHCVNMHDDSRSDYFVRYENAWLSWRHHSILLSNSRYSCLKQSGAPDWSSVAAACGYVRGDKRYGMGEISWRKAVDNWANADLRYAYGLQALGYATSKKYSQALIAKIEAFDLTALTNEAMRQKQ